MRLSAAGINDLPLDVARPGYDRDAQGCGIVHLGIGAFHRGHQAVYTDDALAAGERDWRITAVSLRSPLLRDAMVPQDCLYAVVERTNGVERARVIGAIARVLLAAMDPDAVIGAIADPSVHVVTLTVTEKGYHHRPADGRLLRADPAVADELAGGVPTTIYGFLAAGLERRQVAGHGPLTLVSCDNLPGNGDLLASLLAEFLEARDPALREWCSSHVVCVNTMVDRIVPAVTAADIAHGSELLGVTDAALVITEPFRQWVIEDRFAGPRPAWEAGGARFVPDVKPFELAKLRLLNGSHSTLAYMGLQLGYVRVDEAIADRDLDIFVVAQMREEAIPSLAATPGLDLDEYTSAILGRFANAHLQHRLAQIAADGSQKLPQRWLATIAQRADLGLESPRLIASVAAWLAYTRGFAENDDMPPDPMASQLAAIWEDCGSDSMSAVDRITSDLGIFPTSLVADKVFVSALGGSLEKWLRDGPRALLQSLNRREGTTS